MRMRSITICLIALALISIDGAGQQSGWILQNSTPTWNLKSVYFTSPNDGWVVGWYYSDFLESNIQLTGNTIDGGAIWSFNSESNGWLEYVHIIDDTTGWAVGVSGIDVFNGVILKLTSGGWIPLPAPFWADCFFNSVYFSSSLAGWVAADCFPDTAKILATTDGGTTWSSQYNGNLAGLSSVYFSNDSTGWTVGNSGTILHTNNGGTNWNAQSSGTTEGLESVFFVNDSIGWAVGSNGTILETGNGGTNWNAQASGTTEGLNSVFFINDSSGWAVGSNGIILYTGNGGTNWNAQNSGTTENLESVFFINDSTGWTVGSNGTILRTTTGGVVSIDEHLLASQSIPKYFELHQNYPNPFNPTTTFEFALPHSGFVTLKIYNILGEEVMALVSESLTAGNYTYKWDAGSLPNGIYFYRIQARDFVDMKKMILIK